MQNTRFESGRLTAARPFAVLAAKFPVLANKFPVRVLKFPVNSRREFRGLTACFQCFTGVNRHEISPILRKFPVFSLFNREFSQRRVRSGLPAPPDFFDRPLVYFAAAKPNIWRRAGVVRLTGRDQADQMGLSLSIGELAPLDMEPRQVVQAELL